MPVDKSKEELLREMELNHRDWVHLKQIVSAYEELIWELKDEVTRLRKEVARLKGEDYGQRALPGQLKLW